jgi:hypothetical protein
LFVPIFLQQLDPHYQAALEFEELRLRRELEIQQDLELRRRLQNLASQQIVEELEYRNQLQQLQNMNMHNQQSQQNNFNNLIAQNLQQQQFGHGDLLASLQDEYLLQRHQQLMMQEQMQQRLIVEGLAQLGSQEQFGVEGPGSTVSNVNRNNAAALLEQELRAAALAADGAVMEQARNLQMQAQQMNTPPVVVTAAEPVAPAPLSLNPPAEETATMATATTKLVDQTDDLVETKKHKAPPKNGHVPAHSSAEREDLLAMAKALASKKKSPKPSTSTSEDIKPPPSDGNDDVAEETKAKTNKKTTEVAVAGSKVPIMPNLKTKKRKNSDSKNGKEKKPVQEITKSGKLDGRTKKARALKKEALAEQRKLTDQEQSVVHFLSSKTSNGVDSSKAVKSKKKVDKKRKVESDEDFAAKIVMTFKATDNIPPHEIKLVNTWSKKGSHRIIDPPISEKDYPEGFNLPILPAESELEDVKAAGNSKAKVDSLIQAINSTGILSREDSAFILTDLSKSFGKQKPVNKSKSTQDAWWPTDDCIMQERRLLEINDDDEKASIYEVSGAATVSNKSLADAKKRLEESVEPGMLEILPHCKLHKLRPVTNGGSGELKFCFQTANTFPDEPMVCCSQCSTWRHVKCGGHHKRWTERTSKDEFVPICDRCFREQNVLNSASEQAANRIEKQRIGHLRRCNATNAAIQQFAFARHFQSKWPLGNVTPAHFAGHVRGVQTRHDKAEKMWLDMVEKLDCGKEKSKDRVRNRGRVLERLLHSVEDAGTIFCAFKSMFALRY